jgi:Na+/melibiose symporter-like transporter
VLGIQDKSVMLFGSEYSPESQNAIIQMSVTIFALAFIPVSLGIAKKYGNEIVFQAEVLMCAGIMVLHVTAHDFFAATVIRFINSHISSNTFRTLLGFACSGLFVFPEIFLGEAIEQDSKTTGVKRSGMIYGTTSLLIHTTSVSFITKSLLIIFDSN